MTNGISATALILEYLMRIEAKVDHLQQELQTHIAASVAERRDVRASVAEAIGAEGRRIRAETRRMRVHLGRLQLRIASWEEQAHNDFEGLERERAA